jgi:DNA repair exonuclease SbcCD nuclease subunit
MFIGDMHLSYKNIRSRLDKSSETGLNKLEWCLLKARELHIKHIIQSGDFFHIPNQSVEYVNRLIYLIKSFSEITLHVISGNGHDTYGAVFEEYKRGALGTLVSSGVVHLLGDLSLDNGSFVRGISSYQDLNLFDSDKVVGLICHHWLEEFEHFDDGLVLSVAQLKSVFPNLSFIFEGHIHSHHSEECLYGVKIFRPGSLLRVSSSFENDRVPCVGFYETSTKNYSEVSVDIARNFKDIFSTEVKTIRKDTKSFIKQFIDNLSVKQSSLCTSQDLIVKKLNQVTDVNLKQYLIKDLKSNGFL